MEVLSSPMTYSADSSSSWQSSSFIFSLHTLSRSEIFVDFSAIIPIILTLPNSAKTRSHLRNQFKTFTSFIFVHSFFNHLFKAFHIIFIKFFHIIFNILLTQYYFDTLYSQRNFSLSLLPIELIIFKTVITISENINFITLNSIPNEFSKYFMTTTLIRNGIIHNVALSSNKVFLFCLSGRIEKIINLLRWLLIC